MSSVNRHSSKSGGDISPIREKLSHLPKLPGVYLFKDDKESILYIGKSKSIRNRVRSYFNSSAKHNMRIRLMTSRTVSYTHLTLPTKA